MTAAVGGYFQYVLTGSATVWNNVGAGAGNWLVVIHGLSGGTLADMGGDPGKSYGGWWPGAWQLLAEADAGPGLPKLRAWAVKWQPGYIGLTFALGCPSGVDGYSHLYYVTGTRPGDDAEKVFCVGAASSASAAAGQTAPLYAPEASGLLIGAWISGGVVNYTLPGGMAARAELDGTVSTSRAGEQAVTAHGPGSTSATASAAQPWAALSIVARDATGPVTFPAQRLQVRTEIAPGASPDADPATWAGLWTDITNDAYARQPVTITRGRSDEASSVNPSSMTLELNNTGGKYTRLNPLSPFYGKLSKNTPIRTWVNPGSGWDLRYTGFVSEWPPRQQGGDVDQHMPITASGITRRMNQGKALRSPLFRAITAHGDFHAYWPLETDTASGIVGGKPMRAVGPSSFTSDGPPGSAGAMTFDSTGYVSTQITGMPDVGGWRISWWMDVPADFAPGDVSNMVYWTTPGTDADQWFAYMPEGGTGQLAVYNFQYGVSEYAAVGTVNLQGRGPVLVTVYAQPNTGQVEFGFWIVGSDFTDDMSELSPGNTVRPINSIGINTHLSDIGNPTPKGNISHLVVAADPDPDFYGQTWQVTAGMGYAGERAADRIRRLAIEENFPLVVLGDDGNSEPMGPQPVDKLLTILQDCEAADGGQLYERRDGRLAYQVRSARYNAAPTLILDHPSGHLAPPFEPQDDDQRTRNDVTASRPDGGAVRVVDDASVATVGLYDAQVEVNVASDDQLDDQAGWRVHLGTGDDYRYPSISPNLNGKAADLIPGWLALDAGAAVAVTNPPPDLPPGTIRAVAEGYTEAIDTVSWTATINASPGEPWRVGVLDDTVLGRLDTDGSILTAPATATATSITVTPTAGPAWTTDPAEFPLDIRVGGEVMTVTAITAPAVLNANPGFESGTTGWSGTGGTLTTVAAVLGSGSLNGRITPDGVSALVQVRNATHCPATAGAQYTVSAVMQCAVARTVELRVIWLDSSGAFVANNIISFAVPAGTPVTFSGAFVAPAGTASVDIAPTMTGTPAASNVLTMDDVTIAGPQTFTVTRSVNGVSKSHATGEDVRLATPMILAL